MSLATPPLTRRLPDPGTPFVVYGIWSLPPGPAMAMSVANIPGGPLFEYAVADELARPLNYVAVDELPIVLTLTLIEHTWKFEFLGQGTEGIHDHFKIPAELQPQPPVPTPTEQLTDSAQEMLRESLGLPAGAPIPEPAGPLPPGEQGEEPPRFDPTRHMDLSTAEAAPPLPPPAPPGPPPAEAPQFQAPVPPPAKPLGNLDPTAAPFAH